MTTSAQVRAAWDSRIWQHATAQAITDRIFDFDLNLASTKEVARLRKDQEFNFFLYLVSRAERIRPMGQTEQTFNVDVSYYLEVDTEGDNFSAVVDTIETISGLVASQLTTSWNNTVDFYSLQSGPIEVTRETISGVPVWAAKYRFIGFKNI